MSYTGGSLLPRHRPMSRAAVGAVVVVVVVMGMVMVMVVEGGAGIGAASI